MRTGSGAAPYFALADRVLSGQVQLARINPARAACWLSRRGLEDLLTELLLARSVDPGTGNTRSRLICLATAYADQPRLVTALTTAWDQLSRACHHHAYELDPTSTEARHLLTSLQRVLTHLRTAA